MIASRILLRILLGLSISCSLPLSFAQDSDTGSSDSVVAVVNGEKLTAAELNEKEGNKLLQSRYEYYGAQRKALDDLIDQHLLQEQATRDHITVDQLLQREVYGKLPADPTDDQVRVYYEGMETDKSFDELKDKIRQHIHDARANKAKSAYLLKLRSESKILIDLAPPSASVDLANTYVKGNKDAPVVLVEFADYQCPYCQKVHPEIEKLEKQYAGKVAIAYKDFPLPMHPYAEKAAEAARCAGAQGKFWEMHDLLFTDKKLEVNELKEQARSLNLDSARFDKCLDSGETAASIEKDAAEGRRLGLTGTPSFFINGHFASGAMTYNSLRDLVEQQLNTSLSSTKQTSPMESSLR
ncbi:MAG TPA: thioredoxin domain-containing protein [Terriglobales bacterium]|nr:thioredoxin domain-containing protein [Terriglobales bacterium]